DNRIDLRAVKGIASIDIKKDEEGLLIFAKEMGIVPEFFTAEELQAVEGDFTPSEFVKGVTGVDNVCERSALKNAEKLIVKKTALNGVTVSVAVTDMEVSFE
ncbi:MAG: cobalamin biosynthesis protein, partial [Firmicutes bacterium]|nr:cobalamin biosynthesis protein [Bacillota bacterium]